MKLIYMNPTIGLMNALNPIKTLEIIKSGVPKQTQEGEIRYLLIEE